METRVEAYLAITLKILLRLLNRNHVLTDRPHLVWPTLAQHASELNYAMKENPQTTTHRYAEGDEATMIANSEVQSRKEGSTENRMNLCPCPLIYGLGAQPNNANNLQSHVRYGWSEC